MVATNEICVSKWAANFHFWGVSYLFNKHTSLTFVLWIPLVHLPLTSSVSALLRAGFVFVFIQWKWFAAVVHRACIEQSMCCICTVRRQSWSFSLLDMMLCDYKHMNTAATLPALHTLPNGSPHSFEGAAVIKWQIDLIVIMNKTSSCKCSLCVW